MIPSQKHTNRERNTLEQRSEHHLFVLEQRGYDFISVLFLYQLLESTDFSEFLPDMERTISVFLYMAKSAFLVEKYELKHTYARIRKKWKVVPAYNSSIRTGMNQSIDAVSVLETAVEYTSVSEPQKHP